MTRILVTGAEGFVGGRLVPRLVARGATVIACHAPGTVVGNGDDADARALVEPIALDIRDRDAVEGVFRDAAPDAVVHLAGLSDVADSWRRIDDYYRGARHPASAANNPGRWRSWQALRHAG